MNMNNIALMLCVAIALSALITSSIMQFTQKRKEEANKTLNASQILVYSTELMTKISTMLGEYAHISMISYESDSQFRTTLINKTVSVITQTLAQHNITIPVDPDVLQSLAVLLVERAITAFELRQEAERSISLAAEVDEAKKEIEMLMAPPSVATDDHSNVEMVNLGDF